MQQSNVETPLREQEASVILCTITSSVSLTAALCLYTPQLDGAHTPSGSLSHSEFPRSRNSLQQSGGATPRNPTEDYE